MEPHTVRYHGPEDITVVKWKVKAGSKVNRDAFLCRAQGVLSKRTYKLTSDCNGTIKTILVKEGDVVQKNDTIAQVEPCFHPTVWRNMCAECGTYLKEKDTCSASVAMEHAIPDLLISEKEAQILGREDESRLLRSRQLVLLVDLDQTLIHTTNDNIPNNLKDVYHFQLPFGRPPDQRWYHTKFRPHTEEFLENMSKLFELHICTFGVRSYAHTIARFLDPDGKYFQQRILSRDECFHPTLKTSNLKALFPCGDSMVCIIDDRQDVWKNTPNQVHVKPYHFFDGTADINTPPEADKILTDGASSAAVSCSRRNNARIVKLHRQKTDVNGMQQGESEPVSIYEKQPTSLKCEANSKCIIDNSSNSDLPENEVEGLYAHGKSRQTESGLNDQVGVPSSETVDVSVSAGKCIDEIALAASETDLSLNSDFASEQVKEDGKEVLELVEWEDSDDYLMYLEDILRRIHTAFYEMYDDVKQNGNAPAPDLKKIVPYVRKKVLRGANILFSGVFPTNQAPEVAHAYQLAVGLGAMVHLNFVPPDASKDLRSTTHLVAAKLGTEKVHLVSKFKEVKIVNPDWLWACADRWAWVDENLFPLDEHTSQHFLSQGSPNPDTGQTLGTDREAEETSSKTAVEIVAKLESDLETYSLGMSSSAFDEMLQDVGEDLTESDGEIENEKGKEPSDERSDSEKGEEENVSETESQLEELELRNRVLRKRGWAESSSSEEESLSGELPKGWKREEEREKRMKLEDSDFDEEDLPSSKNPNESSDEDVLNSTSVDDSISENSFSSMNDIADILERDYLS